MSRLLTLVIPALLLLALATLGCERREALEPRDVVAEDMARAFSASAPSAGEGSVIEVRQEGLVRDDDEADTTTREARGQRLRHTVSLGFAGNGKLTQLPSQRAVGQDGFFFPPPALRGFGGGGGRR